MGNYLSVTVVCLRHIIKINVILSTGVLVKDYLTSDMSGAEHNKKMHSQKDLYNKFNMLTIEKRYGIRNVQNKSLFIYLRITEIKLLDL